MRKIPQVSVGAQEGTRSYLGVQASQLPDDVRDYGLAYYIPNGGAKERQIAREKGMFVHPYILAWQIPSAHHADYNLIPSMDERLAELQRWLSVTNERAHRNFGTCKRDRALFAKAIPLIRRLNHAGWMPETLLRSSDAKVLVERYGNLDDECLFTVRNASDRPVEAMLKPDAALASVARLRPLWRGDGGITVRNGSFRVRIAPWTTEVFRAEGASAFFTGSMFCDTHLHSTRETKKLHSMGESLLLASPADQLDN